MPGTFKPVEEETTIVKNSRGVTVVRMRPRDRTVSNTQSGQNTDKKTQHLRVKNSAGKRKEKKRKQIALRVTKRWKRRLSRSWGSVMSSKM